MKPSWHATTHHAIAARIPPGRHSAEILRHGSLEVRWFAPRGFTVASCETAPGPGGTFRVCLRAPDGKEYWVRGAYRDVEPPSRLVLACVAEDHAGQPRLEELIEVTLEGSGARTTLRLNAAARGLNPEAEAMLRAMPEVWAQTIDRLNRHLAPKS